jgi:hypothetical protein
MPQMPKLCHRHMSANCQQIHDTCALCAGMHKLDDFPSTDVRHCANCCKDGHSASNCKCPVFITECEKMHKNIQPNPVRRSKRLTNQDASTSQRTNTATTATTPLWKTHPPGNSSPCCGSRNDLELWLPCGQSYSP